MHGCLTAVKMSTPKYIHHKNMLSEKELYGTIHTVYDTVNTHFQTSKTKLQITQGDIHGHKDINIDENKLYQMNDL